MKILEAAAYSSWKDAAYKHTLPEQTISAAALAEDLFAEAAQREQPFLYQTPESWRRKWLPSGQFKLMMLPLNAAALPCDPRGANLVLKKIHAREEKPIIVDYNRNRVGASVNGYTPEVIVIDGKHRFKAAALRGETHVLAWVGERAVETIHSFSGGGGGGPAPERTTPSPGARLVAAGPATTSEAILRPAPPMKAKGTKLKELDVDRIKNEFHAACSKGYKPKMMAVAPPGCEHMVKGLKKKFGDDASIYKIAWYHHEKYGGCGSGKEK